MRTHPVSAVQASAFEDEYLGYEHLSLSLGHHQAYVCCSVSKASPQRVLAQIGSLSGRSFGCIFYLFQYAGTVSQLMTGCVTCHTCHGCVTDFRPILGNPVEVAHMTSPGTVYISHTKGTHFPLARISSSIPP